MPIKPVSLGSKLLTSQVCFTIFEFLASTQFEVIRFQQLSKHFYKRKVPQFFMGLRTEALESSKVFSKAATRAINRRKADPLLLEGIPSYKQELSRTQRQLSSYVYFDTDDQNEKHQLFKIFCFKINDLKMPFSTSRPPWVANSSLQTIEQEETMQSNSIPSEHRQVVNLEWEQKGKEIFNIRQFHYVSAHFVFLALDIYQVDGDHYFDDEYPTIGYFSPAKKDNMVRNLKLKMKGFRSSARYHATSVKGRYLYTYQNSTKLLHQVDTLRPKGRTSSMKLPIKAKKKKPRLSFSTVGERFLYLFDLANFASPSITFTRIDTHGRVVPFPISKLALKNPKMKPSLRPLNFLALPGKILNRSLIFFHRYSFSQGSECIDLQISIAKLKPMQPAEALDLALRINPYNEELMSQSNKFARLTRKDFENLVALFSDDFQAVISTREYRSSFRFMVHHQEIIVIDVGESQLERKVVLFKGAERFDHRKF